MEKEVGFRGLGLRVYGSWDEEKADEGGRALPLHPQTRCFRGKV